MSTYKKTEEIIGKKVVNNNGMILGEVTEIFVEVGSWNISDLQVKMDKTATKELGIKSPFFGSLLVPFGVDLIEAIADQVLVDLDQTLVKDYVLERQNKKKSRPAPEEGEPEGEEVDETEESEGAGEEGSEESS